MITQPKQSINITIEDLKKISSVDLADLCNITEQAIKAGGGFGWVRVPSIDVLKKYWNELLLIKTNKLIVGRLNGAIAGTLLLSFSTPNNEAQKNIAKIQSHFVAPWARGYGLAKAMIDFTENVQFKFIAEDIFNNGDTGSGGSLVEAAIDNFLLEYALTDPLILGDVNLDFVVNILDVIILLVHLARLNDILLVLSLLYRFYSYQ